MPISDATREEAQRLVSRYPVARSALLPLLHLVQSDEGYVSADGVAFCAETLGLTKAEVGAVSTFYTMYKREPFGDWLLSVCTNPTCKVAGGGEIYDAYRDEVGGEVDPEAGVMVEHVECLGICDAAPVVQINYEMYGPCTRESAMDLLSKAKAGDPPASNWSGAVPPRFREVERELSGIDDGLDELYAEAARLQAAAQTPPMHRSGETDIPVTHPGGDPRGHGGQAFLAEARLDRAPGEVPSVDVGGAPSAADAATEGGREAEERAEAMAGEAPAAEAPERSEDQPETAAAGEVPPESDLAAEAAATQEAEEGDAAVDAADAGTEGAEAVADEGSGEDGDDAASDDGEES